MTAIRPLPVVNRNNLVDVGFAVLVLLGIPPTRQAAAYDRTIAMDDQLERIKQSLRSNTAETRQRAEHFVRIGRIIVNAFFEVERVRAWADEPREQFGGVSFNTMLTSGDLGKIAQVRKCLEDGAL